MSDYSRSIDFTAKDALSSGDPNKVIKGSDVDSEFDAIATASATKANKISPAAAGNVAVLSSTGDLQDGAVTATELAILDGATLSTAELNALDGIPVTLTATELGYCDGVTSGIQAQLDGKAATPVVTAEIDADAVLVSSKVDKSIGSSGSQAISASSSWTPSVGLYNIITDNVNVLLEIYVAASWRTSPLGAGGALFWCDGTNMRILNDDSGAPHTVYYQKMS